MTWLELCPTSWSVGGWRAWRDRILYGHVAHTCDRTSGLADGHMGPHICRCGARCGGRPVRNTRG